tara:strand:+ start:84 stop:1256 length:1173 start_codon:yes stop_codon:yes gene_type:complete
MRILQLAKPIIQLGSNMRYGGIERVIRDLDIAYTKKGDTSIVVAPGDSQLSGKLFTSVPQALWQLNPDGTYNTNENSEMEELHLNRTKEAIETTNPDVIHDHIGFISTDKFKETDLKGAPILHTLHGPVDYLPGDTRSDLVEMIKANPLIYCNAVSRKQEDSWKHLVQADFMIYNGLDVNTYPFEENKRNYLLFLGNVNPIKGTHTAIDVAKETRDNLIIAGPAHRFRPKIKKYWDEEIRPRVDELYKNLSPTDINDLTSRLEKKNGKVIYVGEVDDVQKKEWFKYAKTFLMPINWDEAFGLVMIEAMATGTPAVAYKVGAAPELIDHGRTGYIVEKEDFKNFVDYTRRANQLTPSIARNHIRDNFSLDKQSKNYIEAFTKMVTDQKITA